MSRHVLIIGAGVIGLCCGYYLTRRGFRVSIVEQYDSSHQGCSFGNAGMVVPSHFAPLAAPGMVGTAMRMMFNPRSPFYIRPRLSWDLLDWGLKFRRSATADHVARSAPLLRDLNLASRACYEELAELPNNDFALVKNGLLMLCNTGHGLHEESLAAEQANQLGIPAQILDERQAAELEPGIEMKIAGAVYFPLDCHLSPDHLMMNLRRILIDAGVTFHWNTKILGWRAEGNNLKAVQLPARDELTADEFVLCTGSWSNGIARSLNLNLPMQAGKGYSLTLTQPPHLPKICSILTEARVAVTPMNGRLRFGGTMEMSGLNHQIRPKRIEGIIRSACAYFPQFSPADFKHVMPWCGLRPCSPDGLPYLGRTRQYSNLSIAAGHSMMGLSLGPISGKIIAQMMGNGRAALDVSLLDPDRYNRTV